jgi:hypothetical protein
LQIVGATYFECGALIYAWAVSFECGGLSLDFLCLDPLHTLLLPCVPIVGLTLISGVVLLQCAVGGEAGVMTSQTTYVSSTVRLE